MGLVTPLHTTSILDVLPVHFRSAIEGLLDQGESILGAVYLMAIRNPTNARRYGPSLGRLDSQPDRALLIMDHRILVLGDPTAGAINTADQRYLVAACRFDHLLAIELHTHLLDCAITFVQNLPSGTQRLSIAYNGVHEPAVIGAVTLLRSLWDGGRGAESDEACESATGDGLVTTQAAGLLDHRQRYYLHKYLAPGERVIGHLAVPGLRRGSQLQRLSFTAEVQPPCLLVRTDRQFVLVKHAPRLLGTQTSYGSDAWIMPLRTLFTAELDEGPRPALTFRLGLSGTRYSVHLGLPESLVADARALLGGLHR